MRTECPILHAKQGELYPTSFGDVSGKVCLIGSWMICPGHHHSRVPDHGQPAEPTPAAAVLLLYRRRYPQHGVDSFQLLCLPLQVQWSFFLSFSKEIETMRVRVLLAVKC
jgi:hypothetical protein